ncbi:MAG: 3-oxoacyl-ACP reductase FabG [Ignavibacteria bacterium]|nr:3-oxoacyl-ACP reductase FabG [Ignavibacteria bacterium]
MIDLSNQVALVTGGSRGIGAATAILLASAGGDVAITYDRNAKSAREVLNEIKDQGQRNLALRVRVERPSECNKTALRVLKRLGRIDILVNCAGIWEYGGLENLAVGDWRKTIDINLTGTFNMCRAVLPIMKKQKYGRIINVSSTAGQRGEPYHSHYAASKGGIIAFTKSIALELIKSGIWVNCVSPGWVDTDMVSKVLRNPKERKLITQAIPRGRVATPEEIAGPIVFLASRLSDHIVGGILNVNGGSVLCG